jgi:hypothetical protein
MIIKVGIAQEDSVAEFSRLMHQADSFANAKKKDYRMSLNKYNSAKTFYPPERAKVDEKVNQLFNKINSMYVKLDSDIRNEHKIERLEKEKDSINKAIDDAMVRAAFEKLADSTIGDTVIRDPQNKNGPIINTKLNDKNLPKWLQVQLAEDFKELKEDKPVRDSLIAAMKQLAIANHWTEEYKKWADRNDPNPITLIKENPYIVFYGSRLLEDYYQAAAFRLENASDLIPLSCSYYAAQISASKNALNELRNAATSGYYVPDKIIGFPSKMLYDTITKVWSYDRCANNKDFVVTYMDYPDYKLYMHYVNYSLPNLVATVDSSVRLAIKGTEYRVLAASANFKYVVGRALNFTLKNNRVEVKDTSYAVPNEMALFDNTGKIVTRFDPNLSTTYYFSPDGNLVVTWNDKNQLLLYNIGLRKSVSLTDNTYVPAMSISTDSRTIAYYNSETRTIYFSSTDGQPLFRISLKQLQLTDLDDIEFTGNDHFLRLNAPDSIFLLDISERKVILSFKSQRVQDIIVSPNGKDILLNCNISYKTANNKSSVDNYENLALLVDKNLNLKGKLLGNVQHLFFTPDGRYAIGYDSTTLARWNLDTAAHVSAVAQSCLSTEELIERDYVPYSRYASMNDAMQIENGARLFIDLAGSERDPLVQKLYYHEAENLFERLAAGYAKNIRPQRVPFFLEWYNWIEQSLGSKDFNSQFYRQKVGNEIFDKMVNSPDSVYPQLLSYAAGGDKSSETLHESLHYYNHDFLYLIRGEIGLRQSILLKDPDDTVNTGYLGEAYSKFNDVCNTIGDSLFGTKQYSDRLTLFRMEEEYLSNRHRQFYDTLTKRKVAYANALSHVASSFLYVYASTSREYNTALDSASYYANKGLQIAPDTTYVAYFAMEDAFAHLLKDEVEKAIDVCRSVRGQHPEVKKETMRDAFQFFKRKVGSAGSAANTDALQKYILQLE